MRDAVHESGVLVHFAGVQDLVLSEAPGSTGPPVPVASRIPGSRLILSPTHRLSSGTVLRDTSRGPRIFGTAQHVRPRHRIYALDRAMIGGSQYRAVTVGGRSALFPPAWTASH